MKYLTFTNSTIFLIIIAYLIQIQFTNGFIVVFGLNMLFFDGLYYQILSSIFLHGSFLHLFMNMAILFQLGSVIEENTSKKYFLFLFFIGGCLTSLLSVYFLKYMSWNHNMIGASGAISVLMGCIAYYIEMYRKGMIVLLIISSFAPLLLGISVAWYAHIIGFIIGYLMAILRIKYQAKMK